MKRRMTHTTRAELTNAVRDRYAAAGEPDRDLADLANVDTVIVNGRLQVKDGRLFVLRHLLAQMPE